MEVIIERYPTGRGIYFLLCHMAWVSKGSSYMNSVTSQTFAVVIFLTLKNILSTHTSNILMIIFSLEEVCVNELESVKSYFGK